MDEQYRALLEVISDGAIVVNLLTGSIVETNSTACRLLRYVREELLGRPLAICTAPDYQRLLATSIQATGPDSGFELQALLVRHDGVAILSEFHGAPLDYAGRSHRLLMLRDLTSGVRVQEHLWEKDAQYRAVFDATGDGLLIVDPDAGVVEANPAACRMLGYSYEEMIGLPLSTLIDPRSHIGIAALVRTVREGGTAQAQAVARRHDGRPGDRSMAALAEKYICRTSGHSRVPEMVVRTGINEMRAPRTALTGLVAIPDGR